MANITGRVAVCHVFGAGVIYLSGQQASAMRPGYLLDVTARQGEVDMRNRGLELTRRARAQALDDLLHVRRRAAAARGSDWLLTPAWTKGEAPNDGRWPLAGRALPPRLQPAGSNQPCLLAEL